MSRSGLRCRAGIAVSPPSREPARHNWKDPIMSGSGLERFAAAIQAAPSLLDAYKDATTPAELAALLRRDGYDVTDTEIAAAAEQGRDLSDDQLDQVTGGSIGVILGGLIAVGAVATLGAVAVLGIVSRVRGETPGKIPS
ncbi:Nif11-like leader peptide family natural product precursor [Azospirillum cavernae]|uniref:Nif11-like leader peptide family natural product n=2 Tax=Azospirillum cavernae TaxID=2320860 RepID=A0A418VQB0_9PROT|nr:Nif11-like leader peptide family natural product precursor [Azospirillum cavernae]